MYAAFMVFPRGSFWSAKLTYSRALGRPTI
jgi:hypothetical protein